jgi:hypothetical protein
MPLWIIAILLIVTLALALGIGMSATAQPPPPRRPHVSRPIQRPTAPRPLPLAA